MYKNSRPCDRLTVDHVMGMSIAVNSPHLCMLLMWPESLVIIYNSAEIGAISNSLSNKADGRVVLGLRCRMLLSDADIVDAVCIRHTEAW